MSRVARRFFRGLGRRGRLFRVGFCRRGRGGCGLGFSFTIRYYCSLARCSLSSVAARGRWLYLRRRACRVVGSVRGFVRRVGRARGLFCRGCRSCFGLLGVDGR